MQPEMAAFYKSSVPTAILLPKKIQPKMAALIIY